MPDRPRILICHERFLFRFGADRVFLLLARRLKELGCHVTMLAARFDREPVAHASDEVFTLPLPRDYPRCDEFCSRWFERTFAPRARAAGGFDLIIHGGWPLFGATAVMRSLAPRVVFHDHGVVPSNGYPAGTRAVLDHLSELRARHLPGCTHGVGVSRFIVETQTRRDVGPAVPVQVVLNGADHLAAAPEAPDSVGPALSRARQLAASGNPLLLSLGRFEWGTYKNSQAALEAFQLVRSAVPSARLLVLETRQNLVLPEHLASGVELIGFPDDANLAAIIRLLSAGISTSLWEGYNLPLVELLRAGVPAVALKVGAHAEVAPDPWFLAGSTAELAARVVSVLRDPAAARGRLARPASAEHWRPLTWDRATRDLAAFTGLVLPDASPAP